MEEVFTDPSTATVGVLVLFCQLTFIGISVLFIIQKASYHLETIEKEHIDQEFDVVVIPTKPEKNQNNSEWKIVKLCTYKLETYLIYDYLLQYWKQVSK